MTNERFAGRRGRHAPGNGLGRRTDFARAPEGWGDQIIQTDLTIATACAAGAVAIAAFGSGAIAHPRGGWRGGGRPGKPLRQKAVRPPEEHVPDDKPVRGEDREEKAVEERVADGRLDRSGNPAQAPRAAGRPIGAARHAFKGGPRRRR
jgi:hypothetical protein